MNYQKITKFDTANGPGIRTVLWVSGCEHQCRGCHNPQTWDEESGELFTQLTMNELLESLDSPHISGLTLSGGDPLYPNNLSKIYNIVDIVKREYPEKTIWLYTGYEWESIYDLVELYSDDHIMTHIIKNIDVLVDGPFRIHQKDISLKYCGSSNQRVINVKESIANRRLILYTDEE